MNALLLLLLFAGAEQSETVSFKDQELQWRVDREGEMRKDDSWLNVVGLFWLKEGQNPFGTKFDFRINLPKHSTVEHAGTFTLKDGKVSYKMNLGQRAQIGDEIRNQGELAMGEILKHNHLRMFLIERGGKIALRIRDLRARNFLDFKSLDFYRPKEKYNVNALYFPYDEPKTMTVSTVIATEIELIVPGEFRFDVNGSQMTLIPTLESLNDEKWLIMFQDKTSGSTTYSGGRFLYIDPPGESNEVVLNFNRAINPPCAYTLYATCPLPPSGNWLSQPIEAGERAYIGLDDH